MLKIKKMKTYKFRLYPNKEQREKLEFSLDMCRRMYNNLLSEIQREAVFTKNEISSLIVDYKIVEPEFKKVYSKALQPVVDKLFDNLRVLSKLKQNGRKVGRLRFKGKKWYKTFSYNQSGFKLLENNKLKLSKIGDINIKKHRVVKGNIKQVTIKNQVGKWYAYLITDVKEQEYKCGKKKLGIDLGIVSFYTDSNGKKVENPYTINKYQDNIKKLNKSLAKKKKGSNRRRKVIFQLQKTYEHLTNSRTDFLHKTSTNLIKECRTIYVEELNIKEMLESSYNGRNIADVSWNRFLQFLTYKAENAGCKIIKVNPCNTTRNCSKCNFVGNKIPLYQRNFECIKCGFKLDRDYNSAINIKNIGKGLTFKEIPISDTSSIK